jgi:hypothetical protein
MQKYDFHFAIQLFKFIWRPVARLFAKSELTLEEAIKTGITVQFAYLKEGTGELRIATGYNLHFGKNGNILYHDLEKQGIRSFKPDNLKTPKLKVA